MSRTVVRFQESNDGVTRFSLEYPKALLQPNKLFDLLSRPDQPPFSDMRTGSGSPNHVQEAGRKLFDELSKHPAIAPAIAAALQQQQGGCSPICLRLDDSALADDLPWEAVCGLGISGVQEFFALDERWPVVRMREVMETEPVSVYTLEPPLRITVVLSAAGRTPQTRAPARPQWDRVRETVDKHLQVNNPVQVKVTVFAGEEDLRNHIRDANLPWVTAGLIADQASFLNAIKDSRPQILHFFCHGTAEGIPHLRIGSYTDWEVEREPSIALTARELRQSADPDQNTWLVTLNCCESATRAADARSLASSLVAAGFPAALGMREAIEVQQAHLLCGFFLSQSNGDDQAGPCGRRCNRDRMGQSSVSGASQLRCSIQRRCTCSRGCRKLQDMDDPGSVYAQRTIFSETDRASPARPLPRKTRDHRLYPHIAAAARKSRRRLQRSTAASADSDPE